MSTPVSSSDTGSRVSPTSAQRFAARARRRRWRRIGVAALTVAVLGGSAWLVLGSPWLRARAVEVTGTQRLDPVAVANQAADQLGRPMARADLAQVRERIAALRLVREVRVIRQWPGTLRISITERQPALAVPDGAWFRLLDPDAVPLGAERDPPAGLPVVHLPAAAVRELRAEAARGTSSGSGPSTAKATVRSALAVLDSLPAGLRSAVQQIGAGGADSVWLRIGGQRVEWGSPEGAADKARVLEALRQNPAGRRADVIDVSAPDAPALR